MSMKKYLIPCAAVLLFMSCKKSDFDDLSGAQVLKGVVVIYDTLNGVQSITPAKNFKVYLKYNGSANTFLYSTTANTLGQFAFNGIDSSRSYTIYSSSDTGAVKYYGENHYTAGNYVNNQSDSLRLFPSQNNQNGIHLMVMDEQLRPVPNVTAWVFNSAVLFASDTSAGRVFDMTVNAYGVSNRFNIAPGTYYLRVKTRIGAMDLAGETSVDVPAAGIRNAAIVLRNVPLARNGIEATILDRYATPVSGARVYAYRSQYVFENDTISYNNSLFMMQSNQAGLATTYIIDPGTYYLRAIKVINTDTLRQTAIVSVGPGAISRLTMTVD